MTKRYADKKVLVMGLGFFGGQIAAARYFVREGAAVTVTDVKPAAALRDSMERLKGLPIRFALGGHDPDDFTNTDVIVPSPAVRRDNPLIRAALEGGAEFQTEMNLFLSQCRARTVGVTGSNGKSTTTALIGQILTATGARVYLGGNIGVSLLDIVDEIDEQSVVVLELSSFQLKDAARIEKSVNVAVLTNLSPNHLDWHADYDDYVDSKLNIFRYQSAADYACVNASDPGSRGIATFAARRGEFNAPEAKAPPWTRIGSSGIEYVVDGRGGTIRTDGFTPPGRHNLENLAAAVLATKILGADDLATERALGEFRPLEHRLEFVREKNGISFYNDSISTVPESTIVALRSFDAPVVLIAGGSDKRLDLTPLAVELVRRARGAVLIGEIAGALERLTRDIAADFPLRRATDMADAVAGAVELSTAGGVVLLSPATASYDMFRNFRERGEVFKKIVNAL